MINLFVLLAHALQAVTLGLTLTWNPNSEPDLAGYRVHRGTNSGSYNWIQDVGNTTTYAPLGLTPGQLYHFVVTAYDESGLESAPSNEITTAIAVPPAREKAIIVVEEALYTNLVVKINQLTTVMAAEGVDASVYRYDSRGKVTNGFGVVSFNNTINVSSRAAKILAQTVFWPAIANGTNYFLCLGEIPYMMSGINQCPDGHGSTFTWDGYRDSQNTAGAYPSLQFYTTPSSFVGAGVSFWSDVSNALPSINTIRMNVSGDGRMDNQIFPQLPLGSIGYVGGFGDQSLNPQGITNRANIINAYITRNVAFRTGVFPTAGAVYQFQVPSPDNHSDIAFWNDLVTMYGPLAVSNGYSTVKNENLTNRPVAFKIVYGGADTWGNGWIGGKWNQLQRPFAEVVVLRQSYAMAIPANTTSWIARTMIDSLTNGPVAAIVWDQSPSTVGWDIKKLTSKRIGAMMQESISLNRPTYSGLYGDPTLKLQ